MATPPHKLILDELATALATITTGNGYKTTVATVSQTAKDWETARTESWPWVGFLDGVSTVESNQGGWLRVTMPVVVVAHVAATTIADGYTYANNMLDDLLSCVLQRTTFAGTYSTLVRVKDFQMDTGDPDRFDSRGGSVSLVVNFEFVYHRPIGGS